MEFKSDIDNECAFHLEKKSAFCAPDDIVDKLKEKFAKEDDDELLDTLKNKFNCDTEVCVLKQPEVASTIGYDKITPLIQDNFKPYGPRDTSWFSNVNIDDVLDQMEKKYTNKDNKFLHIHYQMIDFEDQKTELAKLCWPDKYEEGYRCFGAVLNTDTSDRSGQHWMAIYGSFLDSDETFTIEYFNSSGSLPMKQISNWMNRIKHEWQPYFRNDRKIETITSTRIVQQEDDHSCGAYSLYYIMSRLAGTPYKWFEHNRIGDENMHEFRKYLFRPE
ncbi:MAG: Ulp1 family isopeptidase [Cetobacterium sp.]